MVAVDIVALELVLESLESRLGSTLDLSTHGCSVFSTSS
ncbi:hypothetical protein PF003_g33490 [Phytophthora fragariae]|nr:hypothetical protein PF003_g33490 [Phytophthora fragariae]